MNHRNGSRARSQRQLRVGEELRHVLAALLQRGDFRDPDLVRLARAVTVTEVRISPDLRNATAFVVPLGGGGAKETLVALRRAAPFLRGQVAQALQLRVAPVLSFEADLSFDQADRIGQLLHLPEVERDLALDAAAGNGQGPGRSGKKGQGESDGLGADEDVEWDDDEDEEDERGEDDPEIEWEEDDDADADLEEGAEIEYEDEDENDDEGGGNEDDRESAAEFEDDEGEEPIALPRNGRTPGKDDRVRKKN